MYYSLYVAGAGQSITVATADQHLLVETGSPNITFNADVVAGTAVPVYNDLQFRMGGVPIARPSFNADGPVMVITQGTPDGFEVLETTPPLVSVKSNNPDMKAHSQVYSWLMSTASTQDVALIVSRKLFFSSNSCSLQIQVLNVRPYGRHQMGTIFRVAGPFWGNQPVTGEFTVYIRSGAELWCFLWSASEHMVEQTVETPVIWDAITEVMSSL